MVVYAEFPPALPIPELHSAQALTMVIVKTTEAAITTEAETEITTGM
jgi:hypothetical protein